MNTRILFILALFIISFNESNAQNCFNQAYGNGAVDSVEICLGDTVTLSMSGNCPSYLMNNDFNLGTAGTGWSATNQAMFSNPCAPHSPDGTTYMWMGSTSTAPRILTTIPFDVSGGGTISFEMRYAAQGLASPCEGPDQYDEGFTVQYSINNGTTWVTIAYYAPNGDILPNVPTSTTPGSTGQTPFTVWTTQTLTIPPAAQTTSTRFRWAQLISTSNVYDHWGLDNVTIGVPPPSILYWWSHGPTGQNPPPLTPAVTTTYTAFVSDATDTASSNIVVFVHQPPTMAINGLATNHCINGNSSTLIGVPTGGIFTGTGVTGNTFDPAAAGLGAHDITYSYNIVGNSIGQSVAFEDDFFTDKGWTGYGTGGWTRGVAAVSTNCSGNAGTNTDHTQTGNNFIVGTYLGACYPNSMAPNNYLTSPIINCSGFTSVELEFWRWAGCESNTYDKIFVEVFNGTTWTNIWANGSSFSDAAWTQQTFNVSAHANNNPNFRVRFGIGPTDGSVVYIGWNIDDVRVTGIGPITDTLCSFTTTASTNVLEAPVASFTMPDSICVNEPVTITYNGTASSSATYTWNFDGGNVVSGSGQGPYVVNWATDGTKTVTLDVNENGCVSNTFDYQIIVLPLTNPNCACWTPPITILANPQVCINSPLSVNSQGGSSAFQYNWSFDGASVASGSNAGPYSISWGTTGNFTVALTVTDPGCYPFDTTFAVMVLPLPQITITTTDEICDQANGAAMATGGSQYLWSNSSTSSAIANLTAGTYSVTVTEGICNSTASAIIANIPGPTAAFSVNAHSQSILDSEFSFTDMSFGATSWAWNFGDNSAASEQNPVHEYAAAGNYTVVLTVTDDNDCSDMAQTNLFIYDLYTIYLPSAFTPDNDGINDIFGPYGVSLDGDDYDFSIFDRWGKMVFTTNDFNERWNGKINNSHHDPVPGVYTYKIVYKENGGKRKTVMGTVTLIITP